MSNAIGIQSMDAMMYTVGMTGHVRGIINLVGANKGVPYDSNRDNNKASIMPSLQPALPKV